MLVDDEVVASQLVLFELVIVLRKLSDIFIH